MNQNETIEALNNFPEYNRFWDHDYSYDFFYDSGANVWVKSYVEFEDSPTEWRIYSNPHIIVKGCFSPKGKLFSKDDLERMLSNPLDPHTCELCVGDVVEWNEMRKVVTFIHDDGSFDIAGTYSVQLAQRDELTFVSNQRAGVQI